MTINWPTKEDLRQYQVTTEQPREVAVRDLERQAMLDACAVATSVHDLREIIAAMLMRWPS